MRMDNNRVLLMFVNNLRRILKSKTFDRQQKRMVATSTLYLSKDDENLHWRLEDGTEIVQECKGPTKVIINELRKEAFSATSNDVAEAFGVTDTPNTEIEKSIYKLEVKEAYIGNEDGRLHLSFVNPEFDDIDE